MTNLEAIKGAVLYPIPDATCEMAFISNGITGSAEFTGRNEQFDLATAEVIVAVITGANVSEGGYSLSITGKEQLLKIASGIYAKYGKENPFNETPIIRDRSNIW